MTAKQVYTSAMSFTDISPSAEYEKRAVGIINIVISMLYKYSSDYSATSQPSINGMNDEIPLDEILQPLVAYRLGAFLLSSDDATTANYLEQLFVEEVAALKQAKVELAKATFETTSYQKQSEKLANTTKEIEALASKLDFEKADYLKQIEKLTTITKEIEVLNTKFDYDKALYLKQIDKLATIDKEIESINAKYDYEKANYVKQSEKLTALTNADISAAAYNKALYDKKLSELPVVATSVDDIIDETGGWG